ncbi:MAG: tRNA uridine-5-carboxymethylaminomethyl(34) synthesis GTPase MnmE [Deltaproteobacteria bacterium]|nr:MAG: tRNA uridine-5-carboxymethylaminomethyl(34) synthesis GTPase MnmE [Deltaproteobacteria bacterium]
MVNNLAAGGGTIAAISTPAGSGGIGVIRMSGAKALSILKNIFQPHSPACNFSSHRLYYGQVVNPENHKIMDEVLAVYMQAPATYTREDVVEIHCHGSFFILQDVLELLISQGAALAEPGEFTKRAFLNGRIDLTRAEAVVDILSAKTRKGIDFAQEQLAGALYKRIAAIRNSLMRILALLEVSIDFPDEDLEIIDYRQQQAILREEVLAPIERLIAGADRGKIFRSGVSIVIVGLPNAGKSSLLNAMLQEERALVTPVPGTTRDFIEEYVDIGGMPARLIDTAGIREDAGEVEALGIKRAMELINGADLVLFLYDAAAGFGREEAELLATVSRKQLIIVQNKNDIDGWQAALPENLYRLPRVAVSAKKQDGIEELNKLIFNKISGEDQWQEEGCPPNLRHRAALVKAYESCQRLKSGFAGQATSDLLAADLQDALGYLGDIVGETTTEDVLDLIFAEFCLGK